MPASWTKGTQTLHVLSVPEHLLLMTQEVLSLPFLTSQQCINEKGYKKNKITKDEPSDDCEEIDLYSIKCTQTIAP